MLQSDLASNSHPFFKVEQVKKNLSKFHQESSHYELSDSI